MRRGGGGPKRRRLALSLLGGLLALLVLAQLILPRIAAHVISSRIGRYGKVQSVSVESWPAIQLLWGSVGSVRVKARSLSATPQQAAKLLWESRAAHNAYITAESADVGSLHLTDVSLRKRGSVLSAHASASQAAVRTALPEGLTVHLLHSGGGRVEVQASGALFGVGATVDAVAQASHGKLVAHPQGFLIEGISLTLFSDPHVYVEGVGASVNGGQPSGYTLSINASLR